MKLNFLSSVITFVSLLSLVACSDIGNETTKVTQPVSKNAKASSLNDYFGNTVIAVPDLSPDKHSGDFNGDGINDLLWMVNQASSDVLPNITMQEPWPHYEKEPVATDFAKGSKIRLAIAHGNDQGTFLLRDTNSVSTLDTQAAKGMFVLSKDKVAELEQEKLALDARGDVIVIPTEAGIDSCIYWDGSKYKLYEAVDLP